MINKTTQKHSESKLNIFLAWQGRAASFRCEFSFCISEPRLKELDLEKRGQRYPKKGKILNAGLWSVCKVDSPFAVGFLMESRNLMDCV